MLMYELLAGTRQYEAGIPSNRVSSRRGEISFSSVLTAHHGTRDLG
jgi:hypothetical protein